MSRSIHPAGAPAYADLESRFQRLHRLEHLGAIAGWDQAANMPPKGNAARAAALSEMAALLHRLRTDPAFTLFARLAGQLMLTGDAEPGAVDTLLAALGRRGVTSIVRVAVPAGEIAA